MVSRHLSIIIPAHNEEAFIGPTLAAAHEAAQALGVDYELIVVDDQSTDRTAEIAKIARARVVPVQLRQIGAVRNAGAAQAHGAVLVFLDADTHLPPATLAAAWAALDKVVGGGALVQFPQTVPWLARTFVHVWNACSRTMSWAAGCFVFTHRDAFEAVGGFDEKLYAAEEIALSKSLRQCGRFVILNESVLTSDRKVTRRGWFWQHLKLLTRLALSAGGGLQRREGLDLWYDPQR